MFPFRHSLVRQQAEKESAHTWRGVPVMQTVSEYFCKPLAIQTIVLIIDPSERMKVLKAGPDWSRPHVLEVKRNYSIPLNLDITWTSIVYEMAGFRNEAIVDPHGPLQGAKNDRPCNTQRVHCIELTIREAQKGILSRYFQVATIYHISTFSR